MKTYLLLFLLALLPFVARLDLGKTEKPSPPVDSSSTATNKAAPSPAERDTPPSDSDSDTSDSSAQE